MKISKDTFTLALKAVQAITLESPLYITPDGLTMRAVDPANVAMVDVFIQSGYAFQEGIDYVGTVGISISTMIDRLKAIKGDIDIVFQKEQNIISIKSDEKQKIEYTTQYILPQFLKETKIPELKFTASLTLPGQELRDAVAACSTISQFLYFIADPSDNTLKVSTKADIESYKQTFSNTYTCAVEGEEPVESAYSLDYLNLMLKQTGNVDITIRFSKDYPLEITGLLNSDILAKYVLAPRIINED